MDSFIPKGGIIDRLRSLGPNKSPRVTRDDGSHGNKRGRDGKQENDPVDQIDIEHTQETSIPDEKSQEQTGEKTAQISLKLIRDAMIAQATKTESPPEADPDYKKALSAYATYTSITAPPPELQQTDEQGRKTKFGKLIDLIDDGQDHVTIIRGQSYDDLITTLWDQRFSTK